MQAGKGARRSAHTLSLPSILTLATTNRRRLPRVSPAGPACANTSPESGPDMHEWAGAWVPRMFAAYVMLACWPVAG